jgi:hypothetical protein
LTWPWISNWLTCLPRDEAPRLAVISDRGTPIAACFLGRRWVLRHHLLPARAVFLNTTGLPGRDELCVEHNGLLRAPGVEVSLAQLAGLLPFEWDEMVMPAVDSDAFGALEAGPYRVLVDREVAAPFVDLGAVRAAGDYLLLISHKTRSQIRRARRELGPCRVEAATDLPTAMSIFDELVTLHAAQWREKGHPGAFADPWIAHFHRTLIQQRLRHGEIQLLRVRARDRTVGCTYGLIANGRVLVYQSGFARFDDPHIKPGYVCHAAGIEHAAAAGHAVYDPLGGDARYKESLSTGATRMVWLRIQRRLPRFTLDEVLRSWKHGRAGASASPAAPAPH